MLGRLDPLAEGVLLILIGDECKNKEKYLGLDKEYEVAIIFGISTDTGDALGLATKEVPSHEVRPPTVDLQTDLVSAPPQPEGPADAGNETPEV